jgi:hypothetical protein
MTAAEKIKLGDLVGRQRCLYLRVKDLNKKPFEKLTQTERRQFDQWYGECIGIQRALALFKIKFDDIDEL